MKFEDSGVLTPLNEQKASVTDRQTGKKQYFTPQPGCWGRGDRERDITLVVSSIPGTVNILYGDLQKT